MKLSFIIVTTASVAVSLLHDQVDAHAFLMKPAIQLTTSQKNMYAYTVPGDKVPPASSYTTGNAERNSKGFETNYKKLNPASLKAFIMANQQPASGSPGGGTAECGYSKMDQPALPLPDQIEFGNYQLSNREGIHPGPCEAWCDNDIVVPFTMDCRTLLNKPIPYAKDKCTGAKRLTFYWLATHFAPFQVYIGCAPLSGGGAGGGASGGGNRNTGGNSTAPAAGGNAGGNGGGANIPTGGNNGGNNSNKPQGGTSANGGNNNQPQGGNNNKPQAGNANNGGGNNNRNGGGGNNNQNKPQGARSLDYEGPASVSTPDY